MPLINCPECGHVLSDRVTTCIHCGCPIQPQNSAAQSTKTSLSYYFVYQNKKEVMLKCNKCNKYCTVTPNAFSSITDKGAITSMQIRCSCGNTCEPNVVLEKKASSGGGIWIAIIIIIVLIMFGISGENEYESKNRSAFNKLERGDIYSITTDEWDIIEDSLGW